MKAFAILAIALASANASPLILEDGKEYIFDSSASMVAGTMDVAGHVAGIAGKMKARLQVGNGGNTLTVKLENIKFAEYVGPFDSKTWPFDGLNYQPMPGADDSKPFAVNLDDDGLFKSMVLPDAPKREQNVMKSWAAMLQVNRKKIRAGEKAFVSEEQQLQGTCDTTYTVTDTHIRKSISHIEDCHNLVHRAVDDMRGRKCTDGNFDFDEPDHDGHEGHQKGKHGMKPPMNYPASVSNTAMLLDKSSGKPKLKAIISMGTWVARFYGNEGSTQIIHTNSTSILVNVKGASGLSASGKTITDLRYEWDAEDFAWDKNRDLKAKEPFFSSGFTFGEEESMSDVKAKLKQHIDTQRDFLKNLDTDMESIKNAHKRGIQNMFPALYALDYSNLKSLAEELLDDKSDSGMTKSKVFIEMLASTGTSASAMVVIDLVKEGRLNGDRDAAMALTKIPFHIRRPNKQMVAEFEKLLTWDGAGRFTKMAIPLSFGHLVRITCRRAGDDPETVKSCFSSWASTYVKKAWDKYKATDDHQEKGFILSVMANMRFGGHSRLLMPLIKGEMEQCNQLRTMAAWAGGWEITAMGKGFETFAPIFADRGNSAELRITALEMLFFSKLNGAQMANIVTTLYRDPDYEVINYAYTLFERYANSIDPCDKSRAHLAGFFLKMMKQFSNRHVDWSFGASRTYKREFYKKKYGYSGAYTFYVIGSSKSTLPISFGAAMTSTRSDSYKMMLASAHFRIEGLSKGILRKFRKVDPETWKTSDLQKVLSGDMGIRERPDQKVNVQVTIRVKGTIVVHRQYDDSDSQDGGKLKTFFSEFQDLGDQYSVNYARAINLASALYEQPSNLGIPMAFMASMTAVGNIHAKIKRGSSRGLLYRDIEYDIMGFAQANRIAAIPMKKSTYGIVNDRIYYAHFPRKIVAGVNVIKKELKLQISRPEYDNPSKMIMHSVTYVRIRSNTVEGKYDRLSATCPDCPKSAMAIVSKGRDNIKQRTIVDFESDKRGAKLYAEYFGCEMDVSHGNRFRNIIGAFMPYNKNPKTPYTSVALGMRQIRAFLVFFPRTEQCGVFARWSQSQNNPVKEIEISLRGKAEQNGDRMFFRGRKWFISALIKGKGEPADRNYRVKLQYEFTPGYINNKVKLMLNRAPIPALDMSDYSVCMAMENKYPPFSKEFLGFDMNQDLKITGSGKMQYGRAKNCDATDGEMNVKFEHSTTQEARDNLKNKWYYKKCMEEKDSSAWSGSKGWPLTEACYQTVWDGTSARHYSWKVELPKMSEKMKKVISSIKTGVKAALVPWEIATPDWADTNGDVAKWINMDVTFKDDEKALDLVMETARGKEERMDIPLRLNWTPMMRKLKFTSTIKRLMDMRIINPCVVTNAEIRSNDNVTYAYEPSSCWTLTSASCGPTPTFAVFSRKGSSGAKLDVVVMVGGHKVEMSGSQLKVGGSPQSIADGESYTHMREGTEIFKVFRWGSTYNLYSFLKVWVAYDGNFVEVVPAPSTKGQHCGICGNYNRQQSDEMTGKDMQKVGSVAELVKDWEWKC